MPQLDGAVARPLGKPEWDPVGLQRGLRAVKVNR